jgi:hypothetical protein
MASPTTAPAPPQKKRLPLFFVLVPVLCVLGIVALIGWNLYRDYQRGEAEDEETRKFQAAQEAEKVRAAKSQVAAQQPKAEPVDEDELGSLPGQKKKAPKVTAPKDQTPATRAYLGFKTAFDKLESANETAARKFRAKKLQLDDQYNGGKPANEQKFVSDCDATREKLLELLRNPENQ